MTNFFLLFSLGLLIILFIILVYFFDRKLLKKIDRHEKRLEEKGIFKRHFISNKNKSE